MKNTLRAFGLCVLFALAACGRDSQAPQAVVTESAADAANAQPNAEAATPAPVSAQPTQTAEQVTETVEQVAETDEGAEPTDDTATKDLPPLKLAQLPPRAPAGSKFKEGVHYQRLSPTQPVEVSPDQVQVTEFFWYGCPHCFAIEPFVHKWLQGKPDYVVFKRVHGAWNDVVRFHGRFLFAAESLGKLEELHPLIFREIHEKGNPLVTPDQAREFFAAHGVDTPTFQKHFGAMSLERRLDQSNVLMQRHRLTGVPGFVVNGKYTLDVPSAGGEQQAMELINELAAREHAKEH